METLLNILQSNFLIGIILLVVVIPLYTKMGILDFFLKKNGKNGNKPEDLANQVAEFLATNHFHNIISDIADLKRWQEEENKILTEVVILLRDIKEKHNA